MQSKKILILTITLLLLAASAFAIDKPDNPGDPFNSLHTLSIYGDSGLPDLDISPSPLSIMGQQCSNLYKTTGEYCSGYVRIYYQCLQTMDGGEWQQRSENCEDYSGRCIEEDGIAKCVDGLGQTDHGKKMLYWGISLLIIGALAGIFVHPVFFLLVIYAAYLLFKFFMGGV